MSHYPPLPASLLTQLEAVAIFLEQEPGYLLKPECPYPDKLKGLLRRLVGPAEVQAGGGGVFDPGQDPGEQLDSFMAEVQSTINSMKALAEDMQSQTVDISDKMTFLKNYAPLLERFLSMKEKSAGLKQMFEFQQVVTRTMEEVLDKDQRLDFKQRLKQVEASG